MKPYNGKGESGGVTAMTCAQSLMDVTPHVMQALREEMRHHRNAELSVPEFRTLSYIERHPGTSQMAITEHIGLSKASLSKIVTRLEEQGLIRRHLSAADKRRQTLSLTAHGRRTTDEAQLATLRSIAGRLTNLKPEELVIIAQALNLLALPFS